MTQLSILLLAADAVYLIVSGSNAGRAVSAFGCLVAACLLVLPRASRRRVSVFSLELPEVRRSTYLIVGALFVLPSLTRLREPLIAFVRLDTRLMIVVAWLLTTCILIATSRPDRTRLDVADQKNRCIPVTTILFIVWATLLWFLLIWDVGVGRVVFGKSWDERLAVTFKIWESRRPSHHLFLAWYSQDAYQHHQAYTNHLHPYLFAMYACTKLVQHATGLPMFVGRNVTPFAMAAVGVLAFTIVLARAVPAVERRGFKFYGTLFLVLGFFISEWHFWVDIYIVNFDNIFPLIAYLTAIVWACAQPEISSKNATILLVSAVVFAAFSWAYQPLLILALWCYFGRPGNSVRDIVARNRPLLHASVACAVVGAFVLGLPRVLVALKGYSTLASPFMFRSGLDGDTRYFKNVIQAVFAPNYGGARTIWEILFPAFVPLIVCVVCFAWRMRATQLRMAREFLFIASPYFFSLALFPQSVSIHPYLYDHLLFVPATIVGATWCLSPLAQRRLRGPWLLAGMLLIAVLIMANFVAIAQGMIKALPLPIPPR